MDTEDHNGMFETSAGWRERERGREKSTTMTLNDQLPCTGRLFETISQRQRWPQVIRCNWTWLELNCDKTVTNEAYAKVSTNRQVIDCDPPGLEFVKIFFSVWDCCKHKQVILSRDCLGSQWPLPSRPGMSLFYLSRECEWFLFLKIEFKLWTIYF